MIDVPARQALFISHATPEDNAFTLWLGAKLTALGYEVFADILRLKGGEDWERVLEDAIRNKAAKFLLVATPHGVQKPLSTCYAVFAGPVGVRRVPAGSILSAANQ
jgi:hypothetical protein